MATGALHCRFVLFSLACNDTIIDIHTYIITDYSHRTNRIAERRDTERRERLYSARPFCFFDAFATLQQIPNYIFIARPWIFWGISVLNSGQLHRIARFFKDIYKSKTCFCWKNHGTSRDDTNRWRSFSNDRWSGYCNRDAPHWGWPCWSPAT